MGSFTLTKPERLRSKADIKLIFDQGVRWSHPWVTLIIRHSSGGNLRRLVIIVNRKYGNAVRRNRIKRLIREIFRLNKHQLASGTDMVFLPKPAAQACDFHSLEKVLVNLWKKAKVWENS